jgi:protein involved in polysaccharide export with SLBB domain/glycosyltransferase involved in cell wall biosynthesis
MPHIAILGIRGVPAAHGGFETFAERLALYLVANGWRVTVYCQEDGEGAVYEDQWQGVHRVHIPSGGDNAVGTIRFDWRCIAHAVRHKPDVALTLGYNTAVFCARLRLAGVPNAINMDGIEWMRDKWGRAERVWLYLNDWAACWLGNRLIADHPSIARHLRSRAPASKITMIPYGADMVESISDAPVRALGLEPGGYLTLIARPEIENSVLEIVRAFSSKPRGVKLVVLGRYAPDASDYHRQVLDAASAEVVFVGAIYEANTVRALRRHCLMYVHGHRVGGTNPSLVEALAAGNAVLAHQNRFNYWVAGPQAEYFADEKACANAFEVLGDAQRLQEMANGSRMRHWEAFRWEHVLRRYETLLLRLARHEAEPSRATPVVRPEGLPQPSQSQPSMSFSGNAWLDVDGQRRLLRALLAVMVLAWLVVGLMGCSTPPAPGVSVVAAAQDDTALRLSHQLQAAPAAAYLIAPGDELDLRFPDYGQYDQSVRVRTDGKINLQVIGTVHVQGRSPEDVQQEVQERYRALAGGPGERSYLIRPNDEIEIKFAYQPQLNEMVKVRPDGKIALQLAGTVLAQGKSPEELQAELVQRYGKVLRQPELAVILRSFSSQALRVGQGGSGRAGVEYLQPVLVVKQSTPEQVFVGGEVQRPGVLALKPGMTVLQALLEAGGQLPSGELRAVTVLRKGQPGGQALVIRRDLSGDVAGSNTQDFVLQPADVVLLPQTSVATLAQNLDQYLFKIVPFARNSSFGFSYDLRGRRY